MSKLFLELDIGFIIIAGSRGIIDVRVSIFITNNDFAVFIATILWFLYKKKVGVASNVFDDGSRGNDVLDEGVRTEWCITSSDWWLVRKIRDTEVKSVTYRTRDWKQWQYSVITECQAMRKEWVRQVGVLSWPCAARLKLGSTGRVGNKVCIERSIY